MTDVNTGAAQLLVGRRILVTGGARGLGLAFARHFCEAGAAVAIADIRAELVQGAAQSLRASGFTAHALVADLSDPASIERCAGEAVAALGGLDGLVNNAAVTDSGGKKGDDISVETWDRVMNVNVRGTWLMSRACHAALAASGRDALLSSDAAMRWLRRAFAASFAALGLKLAVARA